MWSVDAARAALLVIDMQNDFVREDSPVSVPMARERVPVMARALALCRDAGVPAVFTRHILLEGFEVSPVEALYVPRVPGHSMIAGTPGAEIVDELRPAPGEVVLDKHRYDAFHDSPLRGILGGLRGPGVVDTLIIAGALTEVCCESTARSACARDFKVAFLADATGGRSAEAQAASLAVIGRVFGRVLTVDELAGELSPAAG